MPIKRYQALDILRGFSILYVVFIHGAIYNYGQFNQLDVANLPLYLLAIGAVGLWGGVFIVYSLAVNIAKLLSRGSQISLPFRSLSYLVIAGLVYLFILGTIQSLLLGRWAIGSELPQLTAVAELIRGQEVNIHVEKLFSSSGLKMIGLNLLVVTSVTYLVFRRTGLRDKLENYMLFVYLGLIVMIFSFLRLFLYSDWIEALASGNWLMSYIGGLFLADPYPGIAYLAYGFFGVALGMMLHYRRLDYLRNYMLPLGGFMTLAGLVALQFIEPDFFGPSWFWYAKVIFETGIFILLFCLAIWLDIAAARNHTSKLEAVLKPLHRFLEPASRICLTIYLLETLTSELLRPAFTSVLPNWEQNITACLMIGLVNMVLWLALAHVWARQNYKFSVEYGWVRLSAMFGRESTKLAG